MKTLVRFFKDDNTPSETYQTAHSAEVTYYSPEGSIEKVEYYKCYPNGFAAVNTDNE